MSDTPTTAPVAKDELRFGTKRPKVEPFARYRGTSAWRKYRNRVREFYAHKAKLAAAAAGQG